MENTNSDLSVLGFYAEALNVLMELAEDSKGFRSFNIFKNMPPSTPERYVPLERYTVNIYDLEEDNMKLSRDSFCALGVLGPKSKESVFTLFKKKFHLEKENFVNLIHPSSFISNSAKLDFGIQIEPNCAISVLSQIGFGVNIKMDSTIGHHSIIGDYVTINPGVRINGLVKIGKNTLIGAGAIIKDGIEIGSNCLIGMGSVVMKNVPDNCMVFGNPSRIIRSVD